MHKKNFLILIMGKLLFASPFFAYADTVVKINILNNGELREEGIATVIAPETIITSFRLVNIGDQVVVINPENNAQIIAERLAEDQQADLIIIKVPGLAEEPFTVAKQVSGIGRIIALKVSEEKSLEGTLHSKLVADDRNPLPRLRNTALLQENEFAAPLLNNCGELLAISQHRLTGLRRRLAVSEDFGVTGTLDQLKSFLTLQSVAFNEAEEVCLSESERLAKTQLEAEEKAQETEQLRQRQTELEEARAQLETEKEAARQEAEQLGTDNEAKGEEIRQKEEELAAREEELAREQSEREEAEKAAALAEEERKKEGEERVRLENEQKDLKQKQLYVGVGVGAFVLFLLLVGALLLQKRRRLLNESNQDLDAARHDLSLEKSKLESVQQDLQKASATFSDIVLDGVDEDGKNHRLKIGGDNLVRSANGQVIGRSAQHADYVINIEQVSRQHLRLRVQDNEVTVEDLKSFNGSAVNGTALQPGQGHILRNGDTLRIGTVNCRVHIVRKS